MGVDDLIGYPQWRSFAKKINKVRVDFDFAGTIKAYPKNKGEYDDDQASKLKRKFGYTGQEWRQPSCRKQPAQTNFSKHRKKQSHR